MTTDRFVRLPVGIHLLDLTATQLKVLLAMAAHANWRTGRLRIKHATIAFEVACSRETVNRSIQRLIACGILLDLGRTGRSNGYQIVLDWNAADHIRCDEAITSDVTTPSHLQNESDSNENDSNDSSLSTAPTSGEFQAETDSQISLLAETLGAVEIEEERESVEKTPAMTNERPDSSSVTAPIGQSVNPDKMKALGRARTLHPIKFPTSFDPAVVGYTESMFKSEFSLLDYQDTLNAFVAHHMAKGDTSENWLGKFLTYAHVGQRQAKERRQANGETEPPANKAVGWDAKRKQMFKEQANPGEGYAAWQMRMQREGVELP